MIVISNTSPIVNLAAIGQLDLLQKLYEKVLIPQAVYREITVAGAGQPGDLEVRTLEWMEVRQVTDHDLVTAICTDVDEGEAEAIALAVEQKANLLLLDERRGRMIASRLELRFIGLLGVLLEAKDKGYISAVKPILDDLIVKAGFWVSQQLYARVLQVAGE
ncbi:MAG: DUF3368 domain-containing protein [Candidatus Latescibacteria bacterium]|nr:DUF3368 domain-containing protein [Candidatus Latescibacterota bacterium]